MGTLRLIWTLLCWGTLLVIIGVAVGGFVVYSRLDNEVQKHILAELQKRYPDLHIQIGSAKIIENKGITVRNIEFSLPYSDSKPRKLLCIDELFIECPVTLQSLYQKKPQISKIVIKKPILAASLSKTGTFSELQLLFVGKGSIFFPDHGKPVSIEVVDGTLLYDDARQPAPPLRLSGINITAKPEIQDETERVLIKGTADGDFFRRLDIEALFLPETNHWQFTADCLKFDWADSLWQYVSHQFLTERPKFQGSFDFKVSAIADRTADWGCRFAVGGSLTHGRMDFPTFNRTLSGLSATFEITSDRVLIENLTGYGDSTRFVVSFVQEGLFSFGDPRQRAELTVNVQDCRIDDELIDALSPMIGDETKRILAQYDYEGVADLHAQLFCQNGVWLPKNLTLHFSELGFAYRNFPYRVDHLAGNLLVDETGTLRFRFQSKQGNPAKVAIEGRYNNVFVDAAGETLVVGENVPIDTKLIRILQPSTQQVINSLNPAGRMNVRLVFELPPGNAPLHKQFDIALDNASLKYDLFPYPLRDVTGFLRYDGNSWQFHDVSGTNGTAVVKGSGVLKPTEELRDNAQEFILHLIVEELPVDEQIAQALLDPDRRQLLQSLNVNGKVDLAAQIQYRTDDKRLNLCFQAVPRAGLSICPDRFPYKIENVEGEFRYENGHITAKNLTGTHRNTELRSGLDCRFYADGQLVLLFDSLTIYQLQTDRELLYALPKQLENYLESMQITNPFDLSGGIEYRQTAQGEQVVSWGLNCVLHQNSAILGVPVENIFGIVQLTGQASPQRIWLNGELHLELLSVYGFQATSVSGPFSFDGTRLQLGMPANQLQEGAVARPLTGKFCDGTLRAGGLVTLGNNVTYGINFDLLGANLEQVSRRVQPTAQRSTGRLDCTNVQLWGIGTRWETLGGTGTIQLREANIYGAPVIVQLLRELRIKTTDPNAGMFSSMDVDFRLSGLTMYLERVVFGGELMFMQGEGKMLLDTWLIDLNMRTRLGNRQMQIPVVSGIIGAVGDQLVQLKITGPMGSPTVNRVVVPEIQRGLQQIQPEESHPLPSVSREHSAPSRRFPWNPL